MIDEKTIEAIKASAFKLTCPSISLTQATSADPIVFIGSGEVYQGDEGKLKLSCSATEIENTDWVQWFNRSLESKPGKLFPAESYFELRVRDDEDREWTASSVRVSCNWHVGRPLTVCATLSHLCHATTMASDAGESCILHFFDDMKLPLWPSHVPANFNSKFAQLEVREASKGHVVVCANSGDKLPASFALRIEEACGFLTAVEASAQVVTVSSASTSQTTIYPKKSKPPSGKIPVPLGGSHTEFLDEGWMLFRCYLDYITSTSKPDFWSHVGYYVHNARMSSAGSVDTWAVSVSVAVEGLSHLLDSGVSASQKVLVGELRNWLMPMINESAKFSSLSDRLGGLIGMMADERVKDRLSALVETRQITGAYVKAWSDLRNKFVHPKAKDLVAFSDEKFQQLIDLLYKVTTLMYEIVFHLIGYRGAYLDYGTDGWPIRRRSASDV